MFAVEVGEWAEAEEELGAVGAWASVGHRKNALSSVLVLEVLISELGAVDGFTASTVAASEVTALGHEAGNNSVEDRSLEVEGLA